MKKLKQIASLALCACMVATSLFMGPVGKVEAASVPSNANLLNTYGTVFDYVGNALVANEILNPTILNRAAEEYNSITVGNEMKPDYVLGWSAKTISTSQAKAQGIYVPANYKESTVPVLDYSTVDKMLKACYDKGFMMRGHTLVWHSQTPDWFFRAGYSKNNGYVSKDVMTAREEYFIKNYVSHVCESQYGSVIYAWDVVNEYLHAGNTSGWQKIYGANLGPRCEFVKNAFVYTYDTLTKYQLQDKVHLFYNDYNTYMEVNDVIDLVNYVNSGKKICAGVGMQSHLSTDFPTVAYFKNALSSFCKQGFEVQITELDIGMADNNVNTQAKYCYDLMKAILDVKKSGGNITALVWWGMTDDTSWRNDKPLLYSTYGSKKPSYTSTLQAFFDAGYSMGTPKNPLGSGGSSTSQPTTPSEPTTPTEPSTPSTEVNTKNTMQCEDMTISGDYAGKINSPFTGVALYANTDNVKYTQQFGYNTHDFTLRGCSNNNNAATVDLIIAGENKGTFRFTSSTPQDITLTNITHKTGNVEIQLKCSNDNNTWDAYVDYIKIGQAGSSSNNNQGSNENQGGNNNQGSNENQGGNNNQGSNENQGGNNNQGGQTTPSAEGVSVTCKTTSDWGSGFQGEIVIKNNTNKTYNGWTLTFDTSAKINSLWGGEMTGKSGSTVTVKNAAWDTSFGPGATVTIGFVADGSSSNKPSNIKFNNEAASQGGQSEPQPQPQPQPEPQPEPQPQPTGSIVRPSQVNIVSSTPSDVTRMQNGVTYGTAKSGSYYSNMTNSYRSYNIYLPAGYSTNKKYPVIYMLHGIGGNQNAFGNSVNNSTLMRMAGNMMAKGECKECIIVFPNIRVSNTAETNIFDANNYKYYDAFREDLINNLMPHINSTYSVATGRENTAVAGFSMGGRESLYIGISKPEYFGYTAAFCPAPGDLPNSMNGVSEAGLFTTAGFKLPAAYNDNTLVMIIKGQSDNVVGDQPMLYHNTLQANGTDHVFWQIPGGHDEGVYGNGFYNLLRYAFK